MQIGYARSSTIDQEAGYQAQIKTLKAAACEKIFAEKVSSVAQRDELDAALEYACTMRLKWSASEPKRNLNTRA
jgi:DNA invertase Pin-like site-specific DNA recombinase